MQPFDRFVLSPDYEHAPIKRYTFLDFGFSYKGIEYLV